jgi:arylsulfatase A-like enzyme
MTARCRRSTQIALTLLLAILSTGSLVAAESRPNILFIYTDDHSHRTIGCYPEAHDWVRTPQIDQLAARGIRFHAAYIGTWCMPSRATLLTGHLPYGVKSMRMEGPYPGSEYDPQQCPFWPRVFRQHGYQTAQIGKWHTGTDTGAGRDWDHQIVWNRPRHTQNAGNYYDEQLIETNGGPAELVSGYSTDNYTRWAVDYIHGKGRDAAKPWYLWLCYGAVHGPYTPAARHLQEYADIEVPIPADIYPPRPGKPDYVNRMQKWIPDPAGSDQPVLRGGRLDMATIAGKSGIHGNTLRDWVRQYHQGVLAIDEGVGKLVEALRESGQFDNTLIVFTSDQGFAWGQHGFQHKLGPYDATIRSPLIVSMPGRFPQGAVCRSPVGGADLIPTFFAVAGIDLPWEMHGHNLLPLLTNPQAQWPHPVLTTLTGRRYGVDTDVIPSAAEQRQEQEIPWWVSLRQGQWKYIRTLLPGEIEELYDMDTDPEELTNLALRPEYQNTLRQFREATLAELRRTGAGMVDNLPRVGTPGG